MKINSFKFFPSVTCTQKLQETVTDENGKRITRQIYSFANGQTIIIDLGEYGFSLRCPPDTEVEPI